MAARRSPRRRPAGTRGGCGWSRLFPQREGRALGDRDPGLDHVAEAGFRLLSPELHELGLAGGRGVVSRSLGGPEHELREALAYTLALGEGERELVAVGELAVVVLLDCDR